MDNHTLTAIEGIRVGHAQNLAAATGCTVVLCPPNTVGGVDQRGGAPGTRETDLLRPMHMIQHVNAILLTGGSAYGLDAATGVMRYLEAQGIGHDVGVGVVPIVPGAVIFDLNIGQSGIRPDAQMGYWAAQQASPLAVKNGCIGAGTGAKVGGVAGAEFACKSGIGNAAIALSDDIVVAALMVVNALGDVRDGTGNILAGTRMPPEGKSFADSMLLIQQQAAKPMSGSNTVIGIVATNANLSKEEANKVAQMAHNGIARRIFPSHTMFDGDTIFALATGTGTAGDVTVIGTFAAEAVAIAIENAVENAIPLAGLPTGAMIRDNSND